MSEKLTENQRLQWMLLSLVLILGLIIGLALLIFLSPRLITADREKTSSPTNVEPSIVPTFSQQPFPTLTQSFTPRPTQSPTITPSPSVTTTPFDTPTATGPPTLTPARPLAQSASYVLATWSPEEADHMILLMEDYPNTPPGLSQGNDPGAYFDAYKYAGIALQESLIFFPEADQFTEWQWQLAYNMAQMGDEEAGKLYADLISAALTQGDVELSELYIWFQEREPRLSLYMAATQPPQGYLSSHLVEIRGPGSAFIWLVETAGAYQAFSLVSHFDFVNQPQAGWILAELNQGAQDGDELAVYFSNNKGDYLLAPPQVFNLNKIPAVEMPFYPSGKLFDIGMEFSNRWVVVQSTGDRNDLAFQSQVFPTCPLKITLLYRWNGSFFEFLSERYDLVNKPENLASCEALAEHSAKFWGPKAAVSVMEPLLSSWPPELDLNGQPYPLDAYDEWRYRLGVYYALLGETEKSIGWMKENIYSPSLPLSSWIEPSQDFLEIYKTNEDLYLACVSVDFCDANLAVERLASSLQSSPEMLSDLWDLGVKTHASGYFDFELDDQTERWFTVRHRPLEALQFWILGQFTLGVKALFTGEVDASPPQMYILDQAYVSEESIQWSPVTFLDNYLAFSLQRIPGSLEPYLVNISLRQEYPDKFQEAVDAAEADLFAGAPPGEIFTRLVELQQYPGLLCQNDWSCDHYFYLRGLAAQLDGNKQAAIEAYHRVWLDYSKSPFTTMARLKLAGSPVFISPTPTSSLTLTGTSIPSPTISPIFTETPTPGTTTLTPIPTTPYPAP